MNWPNGRPNPAAMAPERASSATAPMTMSTGATTPTSLNEASALCAGNP